MMNMPLILNGILNDIPGFLLRVPIVLFALSFHEFSHGYIAWKLGDPTAKNFGRLTLNPIKHLHPVGALMMLLFGFGFANPVPVNTRYFKKPKRDMALTAFAGPVSNLLLGVIGGFLYLAARKIIITSGLWWNGSEFVQTLLSYTLLFFFMFFQLNVSLAIFNMLPIPPLDGSRVLFLFLPDKLYFGVMKYEQIIMGVLFVGLFFGVFDKPLLWLMNLVADGILNLWSLLPFLQ